MLTKFVGSSEVLFVCLTVGVASVSSRRRGNVNDKLDRSMSVQICLCKTYDWQSDTVSASDSVVMTLIETSYSSPCFPRRRLSVEAIYEIVGIELAIAYCGE